MPLRCRVGEKSIYSFRLDHKEWDALAVTNGEKRHLRMACCNSEVILKRSRYGTQFFAHARRGVCSSGQESPEHLRAKEIIARAADHCGWQANVEHRHPEGRWVADVLVERSGRRIAFEVQLSSQTAIEIERRDARYRADGVDCVWFLKVPRVFSPANALHSPLFYLTMKGSAGFVGPSSHPIDEFVASVLNGSTAIAGSGVRLHADRYRASDLKLDSKRKVKAVIAAAGDAAGWSCEIDAPCEIAVLLRRNGNSVAVHLDDSWLIPQVRDNYRKSGTGLITVVFKQKTASVSANAGNGTRECCDASALGEFIRDALLRASSSGLALDVVRENMTHRNGLEKTR